MSAPNQEVPYVNIGTGPDRLALVVSLLEPRSSPRKVVTFKVDSGRRRNLGPRNTDEAKIIYDTLKVCITMLAQSDGHEDRYFFEGWIQGQQHGNIHGVYYTNSRRGHFGRGHKYSFGGTKN